MAAWCWPHGVRYIICLLRLVISNCFSFTVSHRVSTMPEFELISQFTEDVFAAEDRVCEHPVCRARIAKGDPCFYVGTVDPGKPGRYVCGPCHSHYLTMPATSVRPTGRSVPQPQLSHTFPDPRMIRQTVNAAQRKCMFVVDYCLCRALDLTETHTHSNS